MAIARRPWSTARTLVFADEPTGNLDSAAGMTVDRAAPSASLPQTRPAVIVVTHDPAVAAAMGRRVLMLGQPGSWPTTLWPEPRGWAQVHRGPGLRLRAARPDQRGIPRRCRRCGWRATLSALGIAIGIAAGVAVLGISASSKANLLSQLGAEANLLTVSAGSGFDGSPAPLPLTAKTMVGQDPAGRVGDRGRLRAGRDGTPHQHGPGHIDGGSISVLAAQPGATRDAFGEDHHCRRTGPS